MGRIQRDTYRARFEASVTRGASYSMPPLELGIDRFSELILTLNVESAERDTGDETYDFYVTTGYTLGSWDIVHFPQIATTGAKTFVARLTSNAGIPQSVTTAAPGVASNDSATLAVVTGATNATKSLAAGTVRHGPWGPSIGYELVVAGTVATGIKFSLDLQAR
jgi:hypothetical protein